MSLQSTVTKTQLQSTIAKHNCKTTIENTAIEKQQLLKQIFETLRGTPRAAKTEKTSRKRIEPHIRGPPPGKPTVSLQKLLRTPIGCAYH